nr:MAG TPA_asm: hypothetical protein [Caudoviricetes sp.]
MKYDVINAIFKNRTDGQSATGAGGITANTTVRHGEAQADSANGFVEVLLDGSDMTVTVACEANVKKGQRVTVINMGGIYKVVSLGDLQDQIDEIAGGAGGWEDALDKATKELSAKIDEARKTATNYINKDATGAIVISDTNSESTTKSSAIFDAYGTRIRRGDTDYATFGEVTKLGAASEYQTWVSKNGIQFYDGKTELLGTISAHVNDAGNNALHIGGQNGVYIDAMGGAANGGASVYADLHVSMMDQYSGFTTGQIAYSPSNIQHGAEVNGRDYLKMSSLNVTATAGANTLSLSSATPSISMNNFGASSAINIYRMDSNATDATMTRVQLNKDHACMNYGKWRYEALPTKLSMGVDNGYINVGKMGNLPDGTADADSYFVALRAKRLAMGLNTTSVGELAYNKQWKNGCYLRKWGPIVIADIKYTVPSGGWKAGTSHNFDVVGAGFKPSALFRANAALCDTSGRGLQCFVYCNPDGTIAIYNPLAVPAGNDFVGQLVWIAAV